uniref:PASTA domain-containing protein n=1 Tax=Gemmiger formicilis TaxID=745368 RepID=UPI004029671B
VVHRDIKPQNIMLLSDGTIKITDFGIARFSRSSTKTITDKAIGSVHYISPEQAKGERTDARTDIYSVGVMLYEMLSGRLPFDGDGAVSIAIMQISEKPKPLAEIVPQTPAGLRQITEKAMEKDPDKRYQSAQEMLAAIEEFKRNPSIQFAYEYRSAEDNPERNINRVVSNTKPSPKSTSIHTGDARRVGTSNPGRSKSAQKKKKKASKGFSLLPIFFGMAVAFVIGAAILIYLIFTNSSNLLFSNRADVQVISFVGMTKDEFLATDYNNLLRAEFPEEYSSEPAGTIIRQTPKAGRTVKEKQRIVLTVSLGTQYVTIPETKNMVAEDAEQTLKDMGLRVTKKPMSDNSVANGAVVYTQPAAGETVEGDSTVILYVSRSEVSKESQVPSLTGKTIEEARNEVKGLNLSIRTIEQASEQPAGTVLSQSPDAGSTVRKSSVITLVVSTGVPEVVATPEPVEPTVNEDGTITVQESWWPSADGSHQIHQLTDGTMWNENGQRCDAQGNPIA